MPNLENASFEELKAAMRCSASREEYKRLHSISMFYQDVNYAQVVKLSLVSVRSVQKWVKAFNATGIDGLFDKKKSKVGRPRKIQCSKLKETIKNALEKPESIGYKHITCVKIHGYLTRQGHNELKYHDIWREVRRQGHVLKFPRRFPEPPDEDKWLAERKDYVKKLLRWLFELGIELWFLDEAGFLGDPRPRQTWARKGTKIKIGYRGTHLRQNVIGSVCPKSGQFFSQIWNGVDTDVFQKYLDDMAEHVPNKEGIRQIVCLDNASWHKAKRLNWHHFEPCFQPAYSPDLNPIEQLWRVIKNEFFSGFIAKDDEELIEQLRNALNHYINDKKSISSTCSTNCFKRT